LGRKTLIVYASKGGVGKTSVTVKLAKALQNRGLKIGIGDYDVTGPKLPTALGMPRPLPTPTTDVATCKIRPIEFDGFEVYSEAFRFEGAVMWHGGDQAVEAFGRRFEMKGTGLYSLVVQDLQTVDFSADLDYLLLDMPPSTSDVALSLFENIKDVYACIVVCQPTSQSLDDIVRTVDMLRQKKVPVLGMVANMAEAICPHCRESYYPFSDEPADLVKFCTDQGIPYLISVPFTPDKALLDKAFAGLADLVLTRKPVEIWRRSMKVILEQAVMGKIIETASKMAAKESQN
jgi:ATP-binding protein involved in chromosome partitioning